MFSPTHDDIGGVYSTANKQVCVPFVTKYHTHINLGQCLQIYNMKCCCIEMITKAYLIFVIFGTPPYFLACKRYAKKVRNFATKIASQLNSIKQYLFFGVLF